MTCDQLSSLLNVIAIIRVGNAKNLVGVSTTYLGFIFTLAGHGRFTYAKSTPVHA